MCLSLQNQRTEHTVPYEERQPHHQLQPGKMISWKFEDCLAYIKILLEDPELKVPLNRLADYSHTLHWTFENQHGWWMLKEMKGSLLVERQTEKNTRKQQFH